MHFHLYLCTLNIMNICLKYKLKLINVYNYCVKWKPRLHDVQTYLITFHATRFREHSKKKIQMHFNPRSNIISVCRLCR